MAGTSYDSGFMMSGGNIDVDSVDDAAIAGFNSAGTASVQSDMGNVILTADATSVNKMTLTSNMGNVFATIDGTSTGAGVGLLTTGTNADIQINADGDVRVGMTTATGALNVGSNMITADNVTFTGEVNAANMTVVSSGDFTTQAAVDAGSSAEITSGDIDLQGDFEADSVELIVASTEGVFLGDDRSVMDSYVLDNAEHARIDADEFSIFAGANNVQISNVEYSAVTGSNSVNVMSDGRIMFVGNVDVLGDGAGRVFNYAGGTAITSNIEDATLNFGQATLGLNAPRIVFGNQGFIDSVVEPQDNGTPTPELITNEAIAATLVGRAGSSLYNAIASGGLETARNGAVFLQAGNLNVTYGETALFQNSSLSGQTSGVVLGSEGSNGILALMPTDPDNNTFALFGQLNGLEGRAAALAGPAVIVFSEADLDISSSRVNGCLIGSAAGCLSAQFGTLLVEIPDDGETLIEADGSLLVPFDPLTGTNNEGLFSDAASNLDEENCERDETGACTAGQGVR